MILQPLSNLFPFSTFFFLISLSPPFTYANLPWIFILPDLSSPPFFHRIRVPRPPFSPRMSPVIFFQNFFFFSSVFLHLSPSIPLFPPSFPASFPLFGGVDCRRIVAPILYFHFNKVTKSIANINSKREQIKIDRKGGKTGLNLIRWKKGKEQNLPLSLYFFIFPFLSKERWKGKKKECQFRNFHPLFSEIRIFSCDVTGKKKIVIPGKMAGSGAN